MSPPRKNQGGGNAVLTSVAAKAEPRLAFPDQFRREFGGRFRFELNNNCTAIRVIGYFGDIGCQKTWTLPFMAGWETEARAQIRAWRMTRQAA